MVERKIFLKSVFFCLIWILIPFVSAQGCELCDRSIAMVWPTIDEQLAEDAMHSICSSPDYVKPGHWGIDLYAPDGSAVFAAFDGFVQLGFEGSGPAGGYAIGRYLTIIGNDLDGDGFSNYLATYGHLMEEGLARDGEYVRAGDIIGYAGGGQDHPNRGDSPGPRLYFEIIDYKALSFVDPFTCIANTCNYWYTDEHDEQCIPNFENIHNCRITPFFGKYEAPSYACTTLPTPTTPWGGVTVGGLDTRYIARISIDRYGDLDLSCRGTGVDRECESEIYDHLMQPMIGPGAPFDRLNCFLNFIRAYSDGTYKCGRIEGDTVVYPYNMEECSRMITSIGIADYMESKNFGVERLHHITGGTSDNISKYIVVGHEYRIIGVNDRNYVDQVAEGRNIFLHPSEPGGSFMPQEDLFYVDYILIRDCDFSGPWVEKSSCKTGMIGGVVGKFDKETEDYDRRINDGAYQKCAYWLHDAGKYYDEPGYFLSTYWMGRLAVNRGLMWYI